MNTVYVRWYGQILQGEVVENRRTDALADMVAVRIPLMGGHPVALFTQGHVYASPELAGSNSEIKPKLSESPRDISKDTPKLSEAWQRLQEFKAANWDDERGHLRVDALEEFYQLWRRSVAEKRGVKIEAPVIAADLGCEDGTCTVTRV